MLRASNYETDTEGAALVAGLVAGTVMATVDRGGGGGFRSTQGR